MDAILLAGGFGTRLRPLTYTRPKPLLPIAGRPMVEWVLDRLPPEVDRVIVAVNWLADELEQHFAASQRDLECIVVRETEPLGTAGAVKNCEAEIRSDRFFVLNADIVSDMDLRAQLHLHTERDAVGTISLKEVEAAEVVHYGVAEMDPDDATRIRGFVEKPKDPSLAPSRLINAGAYLLERDVLDLIPEGRLVSMEKEIFPKLFDRGFHGHAFDGFWIDVGDPARLIAASRHLDPSTWHGPGAELAPDATIGSCVAGAGLHVGAGARLERVVLGDRVTVEPGASLRDCIVGDDTSVAGEHHDARLFDGDVPAGYPEKQIGNVL